MAVTLLQTPHLPFDQVYGPNPVTLTGIPTDPTTGVITADKYVLRIFRLGRLIADLRQTPNAVGNAIFDIQNVLQTQLKVSPNNIEETGLIGNDLANSANESTPYELHIGSETNGFVTIDSISQTFFAFGGVKEYYQVPYNSDPYVPLIDQPSSNCTIILQQAQPFTDLKDFRLGGEITDGKPAWLTNDMRVYDHYVTPNDMTTISYYNGIRASGPTSAQGIDAFKFEFFDNNVSFDEYTYYNITSNGGGPNVAPGDNVIPTYPNKAITLGTGPKNFVDFQSDCTHYYVSSHAYDPCFDTDLTDTSLHYVHRFNIIQEGCNDFPQYQFSWLNSYGFRDYYSFSKRKDRNIAIKRNEFLQEAADYNSAQYNVNIYDRGTTVYSQTLQENFTAFTDYLSDEEALFLQGLFTSADVKVRFNDAPLSERFKWIPISLLSTAYTEKTIRKDKLFQYDIRFKIAHNLKSQRG